MAKPERVSADQVREIKVPFEGNVAGHSITVKLAVPLTTDFLAGLVQELINSGNVEVLRAVVAQHKKQDAEGFEVVPSYTEIGHGSKPDNARPSRSRNGKPWERFRKEELELRLEHAAIHGEPERRNGGRGNQPIEVREYDAAKAWDAAGRPDYEYKGK